MRRATVFICVAQLIAASAALAQSRPAAKDPMSWKDILNKAGPLTPAPKQQDRYLSEPEDDVFGPNPVRAPADNRMGPTEQSQREQQGDELRIVNVKENDALYLRQYPTEDSKIVGMIPPDATGIIPLGESQGQWILVRFDGTEGWANTRFLSKEN
jgi:uncharacterized protein YgiM (DUF1202 family)